MRFRGISDFYRLVFKRFYHFLSILSRGKISGFCSTLAEIYSFITALWILNSEDDSVGGRRAEEGGTCIAVFMRVEVINYCHRHTL